MGWGLFLILATDYLTFAVQILVSVEASLVGNTFDHTVLSRLGAVVDYFWVSIIIWKYDIILSVCFPENQ